MWSNEDELRHRFIVFPEDVLFVLHTTLTYISPDVFTIIYFVQVALIFLYIRFVCSEMFFFQWLELDKVMPAHLSTQIGSVLFNPLELVERGLASEHIMPAAVKQCCPLPELRHVFIYFFPQDT